MTQARDFSQGDELDARSGAFVNDTLPGIDGSVLGANSVPVPTDDADRASERRSYALTTTGGRGVWGAALGGGLLALGVAYMSRRLWARPSRSLLGFVLRRRPRRWSFVR